MDELTVFVDSLQQAWTQLASFLPKLAAAIVMLVVGWGVAKFIRRIAIRLLRLLRVDLLAERSGVEDFLIQGGVRLTAVTILANLLYWLILLTVILAVLIVLQAAQIVLVGTGDWDFAVLAQQLVPGLMFALPLVALGYLQNFTRAYLYALFIGAGITWFVLLESPLLFLVTGILTFGIGIFIFLQFLHRYPRFEEAGERRNAR